LGHTAAAQFAPAAESGFIGKPDWGQHQARRNIMLEDQDRLPHSHFYRHEPARTPAKLILVVALGACLVIATTGRVRAADVTPGYDYWVTEPGGTYLDFIGEPLPSDFFGPGSDPFDGVIALHGEPLDPGTSGESSTIVERLTPASLPPPYPSSNFVEIQMTELQLVSTSPITVTFFGGVLLFHYEVTITLNPAYLSLGLMRIEAQSDGGGIYTNINMDVYPSIHFEPIDGGPMPITWLPDDPFDLTGSDLYAWQHDPYIVPPYPGQGPNFFPLEEMDLQLHWFGVVGRHGVTPPRQVTGCCFPDGSCATMDSLDCFASGGTPMGQPCGGSASCCLPDGGCIVADVVCCEFELGGTPMFGGGCANSIEACCDSFPPLGCKDEDAACCAIVDGGTAQGAGTFCEGDGDGTGIDDACEGPAECVPTPDGTACEPYECEAMLEFCEPHCINYDPDTGAQTIVDCECRPFDWCHPEPGTPPANPCTQPDNGTGTATLPPIGCDYLSPQEVHMIIEGLPPGTTIELDPIHMDFLCPGGQSLCSLPLPPGECEVPGGSLGGHGDCFESTLDLTVSGTGDLTGFNRHLAVPVFCEVHTGPRNPGDPVQSFAADMYRLEGELFGDPDFCTFRVTAGTDFGLPSPGQTTMTELGGGIYNIDSFFDITYQIDFEGCPGSSLDGFAGTTTATIRMETGGQPGNPTCVGDCDLGEVCEETQTLQPDGSIDYCCDCVPNVCEPLPDGSACTDVTCPVAGDVCQSQCMNYNPQTGETLVTLC
jgi:hypothetical protein